MKNTVLWAKRFGVYLLGLFIMACGVQFSVRSALGVSPVTCLANVLYQILGVDKGVGFFALGTCTTLTYCLYIAVEILLLGKAFKPRMLLQILASFIFGLMVTLASHALFFLPTPTAYGVRLLYLFCSVPLVAFGVMLYLAPGILPTPGEGLSIAVSTLTGKSVAVCKIITDCCMVVLSAIVSLVYFKGFVGVREGTVICALLVGFVMKRFMRLMNEPLLAFVERESKIERAAANVPLAAQVLPHFIITISREYGCGGYEIGRKLAEKLGIEFHDKQLVPLEAAESGLSESFIEAHEKRMSKSLVYDFFSSAYSMYNADLSPMEKLFAARTRVLRRIAGENRSCIIMGRCSDYILYNDPNAFRVFIHAPTDLRAERIASQNHISVKEAKEEALRTDLARSRHYEDMAGRQWGNIKYYNLAVDSSRFGIEGSVQLILEALQLWQAERGQPDFM